MSNFPPIDTDTMQSHVRRHSKLSSSFQTIQMDLEGKRRLPHWEEGQEDVICMVCGSAWSLVQKAGGPVRQPLLWRQDLPPLLPWLLTNCSCHCMKTPRQSLTQAKFPYYCLLLQILLFLRSHRFVFLKYKNLLSKAMGHQLCFGRKSVCAEISVKRSGGDRLGPAQDPANLTHLGLIRATFAHRWLTY